MPVCESDVKIPRPDAPALDGKLIWPETGTPRLALLWASANPGARFGAEHMESAVPSVLAAACRKHSLSLLRFNYSGVRGSGGSSYDDSQIHHPTAREEVAVAHAYLASRGATNIAIGGHSMGGSVMLSTASRVRPAAVVSSGTGPLFYRFVPPSQQAKLKADMEAEVGQLPPVPKLFIVGSKDTMSPANALEELTQYAPGQSTIKYIEGAAHNFEEHEEEAAAAIVDFVLEAATQPLGASA